ncbi:hypothetical protein PGT21_028199 [Puccinia graminis f. sp. tritici]|uniref:Uncharacterized protein n=1 Tax=Puccinia graminis f. sp. tritici TaxID=56615 RepID=A0A5B0PYT8_PUCGR|nr:hypothetical protein PGTUg99_003496 [Puccinia graminis f. sp. tritici]KAA1106066.1 hypothetical protein PGT21_028199 [Puccinia graminis f. sp. tritici]
MLVGLCSISATFDGVIGPVTGAGAERGGGGLSHTPPVALARQDSAGDGEQLTSKVAQIDVPETSTITTAALPDGNHEHKSPENPIKLDTPVAATKPTTTNDEEQSSKVGSTDISRKSTTVARADGRQEIELLSENPIHSDTPVAGNKQTTLKR